MLDELVLDGQLSPEDKNGAVDQISKRYLVNPPSA
jgi:hypothetical protein